MKTDLVAVLPELVVMGAACAILIGDLFVPEGRKRITFWATQMALGAALWALLATAGIDPVMAFGGMVVDDMLSDVLKLFALVAVSFMLVYGRAYLEARGLDRGETYVLVLFALAGMMVMMSAAHFITLYLGLEILSLSLYALVALQRDSVAASEAAMKYFVLGALASGMLLYGMSMIYGATGSLDLDRIAQATLGMQGNRTLLAFGLVFVVSGIAFKLGVVPYHMWVPDVYQGAPTPVTLLIGTAPKLAAFAFTLRVLAGSLKGLEFDWQGMLIVLSLLSMVFGNLVAIAQTSVKRMLAYSTIANMGFMLMGFVAADLNGYSAAMFYTVAYVLTSLVAVRRRAAAVARRLRGRRARGLPRAQPPLALVGLHHAARDVLAGRHPADAGVLRQVRGDRGGGQPGLRLARGGGRAGLAGRRVLLPADRQAHVLRRADGDEPLVAGGGARTLLSANGLALLVLGLLPQPLMGLCVVALAQSHF